MRAYGQKLVTLCAHTHTHAAKLLVEMNKRGLGADPFYGTTCVMHDLNISCTI